MSRTRLPEVELEQWHLGMNECSTGWNRLPLNGGKGARVSCSSASLIGISLARAIDRE